MRRVAYGAIVVVGLLSNISNAKETIAFAINAAAEQEIQTAVSSGHQPWRMDPIAVAIVTLKGVSHEKIKYRSCKVMSPRSEGSTVECCNRKSKYVVHLRKIVGPNAIWTATSVDIDVK